MSSTGKRINKLTAEVARAVDDPEAYVWRKGDLQALRGPIIALLHEIGKLDPQEIRYAIHVAIETLMEPPVPTIADIRAATEGDS